MFKVCVLFSRVDRHTWAVFDITVKRAWCSSFSFRTDSQTLLPANPIKYLKKSTEAQSGCRTQKWAAGCVSDGRHESRLLRLTQQCLHLPLSLEPPCWKSCLPRVIFPLAAAGGVCQWDLRACVLCLSLCRAAETLPGASALGSSYFHFSNNTCSSVCSKNTGCVLPAVCEL